MSTPQRHRRVGSGRKVSGIGGFLGMKRLESGICEQKISRSWHRFALSKKEGSECRAFARTSQNQRSEWLLLNFLGLAIPLNLAVLLVHAFDVLFFVSACCSLHTRACMQRP